MYHQWYYLMVQVVRRHYTILLVPVGILLKCWLQDKNLICQKLQLMGKFKFTWLLTNLVSTIFSIWFKLIFLNVPIIPSMVMAEHTRKEIICVRITHNACSINPGSDYLQSDDILFLNDIVLLFALVARGIYIGAELHISWYWLEQ